MWHVYLLGDQRIVNDDDPTGKQVSTRAMELLAFLVVHAGTAQPRRYVAGVLWPDSTEQQARTNLRRELHDLRSVLATEALDVDGQSLTWRDGDACDVDVLRFRAAHAAVSAADGAGDRQQAVAVGLEAIALYRGDLVPASYSDWLGEARESLHSECIGVCERIATLLRDEGRLSEAQQVLRRHIQLDPLSEPAHRALMRVQTAAGDRAAAMATFHRCASTLERELGVAPSPETQELAEALTAVDDDTGVDHQSRPVTRTITLVERDEQLRRLTGAWDAVVRGGRAGVVVISGDPGVGKSRLASELVARARRSGGVAATARCFGQSGTPALAPVAEWLRSREVRQGVAALPPHWRAEIARLVPTTGTAGPDETEPRRSGASRAMVDGWRRNRFFEALVHAVVIRRRPTVLVLDDLQWCDEETLAWVGFALRHGGDARLLVVTTVRDDEPRGAAAVRQLRAYAPVTEVALSPFGEQATAVLAGRLTGSPLPPERRAMMHAVTGGYPLLVVEACLAPTTQPDSTTGVEKVLRRRLDQVRPSTLRVAELAAAVGRDFSLDLLDEASDLDPVAVVRAVDELWRLRIVREQRGGYDFTHDMLRDAAYAQVSPAQRWLLHRRLAQGMELLYADRIDEVSAQIAEQYDRAGRFDRAVHFYRRAGDAACALFANRDAIRLYSRCLALIADEPATRARDVQELELLQELAPPVNAVHGYSSQFLERTQQRSIELAEQLGEARVLLHSLIGLWAVRFVQGQARLAHGIAERAFVLADEQHELVGQAHFVSGGSGTSLGMLRFAVEQFELARVQSHDEVSLPVGTRPEVHACAWSAHAYWLLGEHATAGERSGQAIERARAVGHPYSLAVALAYAAITHQLLGDVARVRNDCVELTALCERYGFIYYSEWSVILSAWASPDGDVPATQAALARLRAQRSRARMPYWLSLLADQLERSGDRDGARASLDAGIAGAHASDDVWWLPEVLRRRSTHETGAAARRTLREALTIAESQGSVVLAERCRRDLRAVEGETVTTGPMVEGQ